MADISKLTLTVKKEDGTTVTTTYDIKDEIAREQLSAIPDGIYPDMTVGSVMSSDGSTDSTPYLYRESGGGVEVGSVEEDSIVGGTVAFNQLTQKSWITESTTSFGLTITNNGDGTVTIDGTVTDKATSTIIYAYIKENIATNFFHCVKDHKYLYLAPKLPSDVSGENVLCGSTLTMGYKSTNGSTIANCRATGDTYFYGRFENIQTGAVFNKYKYWLDVIDLTQMFGSTIADYIYSLERAKAGAGVAWFKKLFPKDHYEYNTGELMSVEGLQSHDMVGFNQWNEEWELGLYNESTGAAVSGNENVRSKNYIPVVGGQSYYFNAPQNIVKLAYDADKNYIGKVGSDTKNVALTMPNNCAYIKFYMYKAYGTTYNHDICINLSSDRNGEYEPYIKHSYPIDSSLTLRGIPKVADGKLYYDGDIYSADGKVQRKYGVVTLDGTENWTYSGSTGRGFYVPCNSLVKTTDYRQRMTCNRLTVVSQNYSTSEFTNGQYVLTGYADSNNSYPDKNWIYVKTTDDVTDTDTLKSWLASNPITVVYELATPTEETAEPYEEYQHVTNGGTEEYVSTGIVPVGHVTKYPTDIVSKVNGLPSDFSTLIAPTEKEFKATKAYSLNQFLIVNNQLYRVTSVIANGATITVGTNVVATTIADILTQLLNA